MMKGGHGDTRERVCLPRYCLTGQTGSVRYMAPEVSLGEPYNQAVDVYSFSMVLWEMLHMKKPYFGMNVETHRQQVSGFVWGPLFYFHLSLYSILLVGAILSPKF